MTYISDLTTADASAGREERSVTAVREYWQGHTLGLQYVKDKTPEVGTKEFWFLDVSSGSLMHQLPAGPTCCR